MQTFTGPSPPAASIASRCSRQSTITVTRSRAARVSQLTQRFPVHRRVGDDQIVGPEFRQPERFRQREAQRSAEPGGQRTLL